MQRYSHTISSPSADHVSLIHAEIGKAAANHTAITGNSHAHKSTWLSTSRFAKESGSRSTTRLCIMRVIIAGEGDWWRLVDVSDVKHN